MKEAMFYEKLAEGRVLCTLCSLYCKVKPGQRGACGVRVNLEGILYTLVYDKIISRNIDPIEKKPLFHFYPGSRSYSIATVGCNFRCLHCQNYEISQQPKGGRIDRESARLPRSEQRSGTEPDGQGGEEPEVLCLSLRDFEARIPGEAVAPEEIVRAAKRTGCRSISYTYTEPTIFYELAFETARLATAEGIANVFVTNGSITEKALETIAPYLQGANIDLKNFNETAHKRMTGAKLGPILEAIRWYKRLGIWIEVTTLVIPGHNDSDQELRQIAEFVRGVGDAIPWHVTQFYPTYRLLDRERTPVSVLRRARQIGYEAGLRYVYEGNVPGEGGENTYCHACKQLLVERYGFAVLKYGIKEGLCPHCKALIPGVGL
jgi:pyruvate formate lyase activating enzyme